VPTVEGPPVLGFRRVRRYTSNGHPFEVDEPVVPHIPDLFLHAVVYLYPTEAAARSGARQGGSGFLVRVGDPPGFLYAVTNKHVAWGSHPDPPSPVLRVNTWDGGCDAVPLKVGDWVPHQDHSTDLVVARVEIDPSVFCYFPLEEHWFAPLPPQPTLEPDAIWLPNLLGPGTETFYVGRYVHHEGLRMNLPTVRFGNLAAMPSEPIAIRGMDPQVGYLMEARSLGGYSGSPVFAIAKHYMDVQGRVDFAMATLTRLIGVHCAQLDDRTLVRGKDGQRTGLHILQKTGMMVVIPAEKLRERLYSGGILKRRQEEQEKRERDRAEGAAPESAAPEVDAEPFTREDFLDKLERVSKPKGK
jgi:hypothetical protein